MPTTYQKLYYDKHPAFHLHHTFGQDAGASTLGHLHSNNTHMMLIFFLKGSGFIKIAGHHYSIGEGDGILLNPSEIFVCSVRRDCYHERIVLHLHKDFLKGTPYEAHELFRPFLDRGKGMGNQLSAQLLRENGIDRMLCRLLDTVSGNEASGVLLAYAQLIELLHKLNQAVPQKTERLPEREEANTPASRFLNYLDQHYREPICIEQVAAHFGISKSYLSHLFKEHVGISVWNYVILRRLDAFHALVRGGHSVEDASWQVGFANYSNFFRLYKKHTGMTPMQFKKQLHTGR